MGVGGERGTGQQGQNEGRRGGAQTEEGSGEGQGVRRESKAGARARERRSERSGLPEGLAAAAQSPWAAPHRGDACALRSAPSGFRVLAEGRGGGASHLPAGPGEEKGSPCH